MAKSSTDTSKTPPKPTKTALEAVLEGDEKILWSSRPGAGAYALAHIHSAVMGLAYFILAVIWNAVVVKAVSLDYVWVVTWLFVGLGGVYAVIPAAAFLRSKIYVFYALTSKRLIILNLFPSLKVQSFPIEKVQRVVVKNVLYGVGSLVIDAPGASSKNPAKAHAGFYGVPYVARVAEAFNRLKNPQASHASALEKARVEYAQTMDRNAAQAAALMPHVPLDTAPQSAASDGAAKSSPKEVAEHHEDPQGEDQDAVIIPVKA